MTSSLTEDGAASPRWRAVPRSTRRRLAVLLGYIGVLTLFFARPLAQLFSYSARSDLFSYIPLVPPIAVYLFYVQHSHLGVALKKSVRGTAILGAVGLVAMAAAFMYRGTLTVNDYLTLTTAAYVSLMGAGGFLFLGSGWMAAAAFPVAFLLFMIPLPEGAVYWLEHGSAAASADAAQLLITMTGTPLLRDGMLLVLPGITLEVAQECSGIRSSWVLFITSVVASHLFLASPWRRLALVAFVIPLAILRNGFRIMVIALLCVRVGPHMIDSIVHRRGGPLFFALSLIPLFLLVTSLRRGERSRIAAS